MMPPLFILPLAGMSMDIHTSIFWMAGLIALCISVFNICKKVVNILRKKDRDMPLADITRPTLTILFIIMAVSSVRYSLAEAENFALNTAKSIQEKCDATDSCPDFIATWNMREDSFECDTLAGGLVKYRLLYDVTDDKQGFSIMLRINVDSHLYFRGGVGKEVERH